VSTIATANIANCGTDERLDLFKHYILEMTDRGITGRINPYYSPNVPDTTLSKGRAVKVYNELAIMLLHKGINRWSPFTDIVNSLKGNQNVVCVFTLCDVYHTHSATVILGDGSITSCMRGHRFARHPVEMNTRDEILQLTPQTNGGCKDCEFFSKCHGGCPSNTTDWRYKDYFCPVWRSLFEFYSKIFKVIGMDIKEKETSDIDIQQSGDNHSDGITHIDDLLKHLDSDWIPEKQIQREKPFGENHSDGIEHIDNLNRHLDG
jgi:radical SAM protein with 4Fe4S-binding SPASM domain